MIFFYKKYKNQVKKTKKKNLFFIKVYKFVGKGKGDLTSQDIPMLQKVIDEMPQEEAAYHMKRCVDSGLWVP